MFKKTNNKKIKGSGILVVILSAIAFSIYAISSFAEQEHYSIILNKYEKNIIDVYEKDIDNIDELYENIITKIQMQEDI